MIRVEIRTDSEGLIQEFTVKGHAGFDEYGKDIVCAAVSAVVQTAVIGLKKVAGIDPEHIQSGGFVKCVLPDRMSEEENKAASIIVQTMLAGLQSIKSGYPNLISIQERTVE